jgi:hypothetical protein
MDSSQEYLWGEEERWCWWSVRAQRTSTGLADDKARASCAQGLVEEQLAGKHASSEHHLPKLLPCLRSAS